jgi:hypothetical protein
VVKGKEDSSKIEREAIRNVRWIIQKWKEELKETEERGIRNERGVIRNRWIQNGEGAIRKEASSDQTVNEEQLEGSMER